MSLQSCRHQEIAELVNEANSTDSPDIGSPPASQFVDEDPIKIDLPVRTSDSDQNNLPGLDLALSINLEQRKKRRDSLGPTATKRPSRFEPTQGSKAVTAPALKIGAKRKLSVREDDEPEESSKAAEMLPDDDKKTSVESEPKVPREPPIIPEKMINTLTKEAADGKGRIKTKTSTHQSVDNRKILAPKSVNNSPKKGGRGAAQMVAKDAKLVDFDSTKSRAAEPKTKIIIPQEVREPIVTKIDILPEPETPAPLDIFSPPSSEPSTARTELRDTPPPSELNREIETQRPSRRSRPAVSYAEPNLRDKMRRPTKDLVDAVTGEGKTVHRLSSVKLEDDSAPSTAAKVKEEPGLSDNWKSVPTEDQARTEPNSPLSGKTSVSTELPSTITTHRRRRESILQESESDGSNSMPSSAISALLAERRRSRLAARQEMADNDKEQAKSDVYEFTSSSPTSDTTRKPSKEKVPAKGAKRHSSVPQNLGLAADKNASDGGAPDKGVAAKSNRRQTVIAGGGSREERMERVLARRKSMIS